VGRQTVTNYVSKRKKELAVTPYSTAMYTLHAMCEAQVDFGEVLVIGKNGAEEKWHILVLSFTWSNAGFMQVCRNETKECLCEALQKVFDHIGGVPFRILFDNMSSAVVHIEADGNRKLTEMFMRFTMHHRYNAEFCNPDSPHEKGNVENKVGYLRRNYLLPPPRIEDLAIFNQELLQKCSKDLEREHYRKGELISEIFAEEQKALIPRPAKDAVNVAADNRSRQTRRCGSSIGTQRNTAHYSGLNEKRSRQSKKSRTPHRVFCDRRDRFRINPL